MEKNTYTPISEFIADLKATNWIKDNPHLLDENSVARWVYLALKSFGRNVKSQYEDIVHISNYRGEMPENFSDLNLAIYCEADFVSTPKGIDPIRVQHRLVAEKVTTPTIRLCEECEHIPDPDRCSERVVENLYIDPTTKVSLHYKNFRYVKLGKDLIKSHCASDCMNRGILDSPYEVNIKGTTLYSNFREGSLYIRFYGFPMDDEGLPVIPHTPNGYLESYMEYHVKKRILEDAMLSKDSANQQNIFNYIVQQELDLFNKAKADTSKIDMVALYRAIGSNRQRMNRFNINLGTYRSNYNESFVNYTPWNNNQF